MSIRTQIDRINTEVSDQSTILDEIIDALYNMIVCSDSNESETN